MAGPEERGHAGAPDVELLEAEGKSYLFLLGGLTLTAGVAKPSPGGRGMPAHRGPPRGALPRIDSFPRGHSSEAHLRMA